MTDLRGHVIRTGADGVLETPTAEVDKIVEALRGERRIVLHFHGGLVDEKARMRAAEGLLSTYKAAGAYPVFFIWRSGILDILVGNLREIASERAFEVLTKWVLKFAVGKLRQAMGLAPRGAPLPTPSDHEVYLEIDRAKAGDEPYADEDAIASATPEELSEAEATELESRLRDDPELQAIGVEIAESALPEEVRTASRGVTVTERKSEKTLMSPEVVEELQSEARVPEGQKGLLTSAALARRGVKVLTRVIGRFRSETDHGLYPTVVEELLRELYLANVGTVLWRAMKKETLDTFQPGDPPRGGRYFLDRLVPLLGEGASPEITLVGHSTGAVYINHLLGDVERLRGPDGTGALAKFRFRHIAFLAPACTFSDFAGVLVDHEHLWQDFRMFTMTDEAEREDTLVPLLYPRSLLYFVSGVLETDAAGKPEPAKPLVGLQRYYERPQDAVPDEILSAREYVIGDRVVWSPVDGQPGLSSGAVRHGDFDNDPKVRDSLRAMIEGRGP